jgi:hypothetical protein
MMLRQRAFGAQRRANKPRLVKKAFADGYVPESRLRKFPEAGRKPWQKDIGAFQASSAEHEYIGIQNACDIGQRYGQILYGPVYKLLSPGMTGSRQIIYLARMGKCDPQGCPGLAHKRCSGSLAFDGARRQVSV